MLFSCSNGSNSIFASNRSMSAGETAVKTRIWIPVSMYVLVGIVRKRLGLEASFYQIPKILSLTVFEKVPILSALNKCDSRFELVDNSNQLILCYFRPDSNEMNYKDSQTDMTILVIITPAVADGRESRHA